MEAHSLWTGAAGVAIENQNQQSFINVLDSRSSTSSSSSSIENPFAAWFDEQQHQLRHQSRQAHIRRSRQHAMHHHQHRPTCAPVMPSPAASTSVWSQDADDFLGMPPPPASMPMFGRSSTDHSWQSGLSRSGHEYDIEVDSLAAHGDAEFDDSMDLGLSLPPSMPMPVLPWSSGPPTMRSTSNDRILNTRVSLSSVCSMDATDSELETDEMEAEMMRPVPSMRSHSHSHRTRHPQLADGGSPSARVEALAAAQRHFRCCKLACLIGPVNMNLHGDPMDTNDPHINLSLASAPPKPKLMRSQAQLFVRHEVVELVCGNCGDVESVPISY